MINKEQVTQKPSVKDKITTSVDANTKPRTEEEVKKEPYEQYKEKFVVEKIVPYAQNYNYSKFSDNDFVVGLRKIKQSYREGKNTYNTNADSFSVEELEILWQTVDLRLREMQIEREKETNLEEAAKITSGKWKYLPDGRLAAKAKNPCVIGGVHGDETTLLKDMENALKTQRAPVILLDSVLGYSNWQVNPQAIDHNVRAFSVSKQEADEASDMNRKDIDDPTIRDTKKRVLGKISAYNTPFLLDCHNDNFLANDTNSEKKQPYAYITDAGDVDHKISLATELGLHRVIIVPREALAGSTVESLRDIKPQSDGMFIEVDGRDKNSTSAKIALRFLQMSGALNHNRPSSGVQILHEFQTKFLPPNPDLKIFKMEFISEDKLGLDASADYQIINGKPMRITHIQIKDGVTAPIPMTKEEKEYF